MGLTAVSPTCGPDFSSGLCVRSGVPVPGAHAAMRSWHNAEWSLLGPSAILAGHIGHFLLLPTQACAAPEPFLPCSE
jgi:hypothetical protein